MLHIIGTFCFILNTSINFDLSIYSIATPFWQVQPEALIFTFSY